jgi:hypothetical protein
MNEMLKRLLLVELRKQGFTQARYDPEKDAVLPTPDFPKIEMRENEIWFPREEPKYVLGEKFQTREELEAPARKLTYGMLLPIFNNVTEMTAAWENAKPLPIRDVSEFRFFSEYNNILLAARDDGDYGLHFVTWEYSYDRKGVGQGHYTTDYEGAKKDFATRSGLIQEKTLFQPEQLKQIYSALLFQGKNDDELTYDTEKELQAVIKKLENICPDLKELQAQQEREHEAEPELE